MFKHVNKQKKKKKKKLHIIIATFLL
jgi:hypothetical protein